MSAASLVTHKMIHTLDETGRRTRRERVAITPEYQRPIGALPRLRTPNTPRNVALTVQQRVARYVTQLGHDNITAAQNRRANHKNKHALRVTV